MRKTNAHISPFMRLPLFLQIWGLFSLLMVVPAVYGWFHEDYVSGRAFLFSGVFGLLSVWIVALVLENRPGRSDALGQLLALFAAFALLPAFLAIPVADALNSRDLLSAYVDMVSAITTTGADVRRSGVQISPSVQLWRALVAWGGGLMIWVAASAVLAPLSLGGFEVTAQGAPGQAVPAPDRSRRADPRQRLWNHAATLAPVYTGLTAAAAILLMVAGEDGFVALCHAMSVMSTSGISPTDGVEGGAAGRGGEAILFLFMAFALSRLTFSTDTAQAGQARLDRDPEFRIGLVIILGVTFALFARHWLASYDMGVEDNFDIAFRAFWGGLFSAMSFLTTTGFVSADWEEIRIWSGLGSPGMILLGLAVIGGGVATTAGGVKLLRVWALYTNGLREIDRLVYPSSVTPMGRAGARIQRDGAFLAWVAFMLTALSLTLLAVGFAGFGMPFEEAMVFAVSGLSTTGPLLQVATETPLHLGDLQNGAKLLYCLAMVLGRFETLAIVALFAPELWRN